MSVSEPDPIGIVLLGVYLQLTARWPHVMIPLTVVAVAAVGLAFVSMFSGMDMSS
jgi:hypothetical protein